MVKKQKKDTTNKKMHIPGTCSHGFYFARGSIAPHERGSICRNCRRNYLRRQDVSPTPTPTPQQPGWKHKFTAPEPTRQPGITPLQKAVDWWSSTMEEQRAKVRKELDALVAKMRA